MKKIIRCIIISFIFLSYTTICAQETTSSIVKSTEIEYGNEAYKKDGKLISWNISNNDMQRINHDFYKSIALETNTLGNIDYLLTTDNADSQRPLLATTGSMLSGDSDTIALHKSCTPFIIAMIFLLSTIIAFIILRRIKTNTLKLF